MRTTGPTKAKIQASHTMQMVITFFNSRGLIDTYYMPGGQTTSNIFIIETFKKFENIFSQKRPIMASQSWFA